MSGAWGIAKRVIDLTGGVWSSCVDHTLPPWSIGELLSGLLDDWQELDDWQGLPGSSQQNSFSNTRKAELPFERDYTYQACAGLGLMLVLVRELRHFANFGELWQNVNRDLWPRDTYSLIFGQGAQPTVLAKDAMRAAAEQFNLRHSFFATVREMWKYRNTVLLQIGLPLDALLQLPDHVDKPHQTVQWLIGDQKALQDSRFTLDGQQQSEELMALRSPTFSAAWNLLRRWRNGNIGETRLRDEFNNCDWFAGFEITEVMDAARNWKPRPTGSRSAHAAEEVQVPFMSEVQIQLAHTEAGLGLAFTSSLINLEELGLANEEEAVLILRLNDKPVPRFSMWSPHLSLLCFSNEVRCELFKGDELSQSCLLRLWEDDRAVAVFQHPGTEARPARQVMPRQWASMAPTRSYVLLLRDEVELAGVEGATELELGATGWRAVEVPAGSWQAGKLEAVLDGALVFWTDGEIPLSLPDLECCFTSPELPALADQFLPYGQLVRVFNQGDDDIRAFVKAGQPLAVGLQLKKHTQVIRNARCEATRMFSTGHQILLDKIDISDRVGKDGLPIDLAIATSPAQRAVWHRLWLPVRATGLLLRRGEVWTRVREAKTIRVRQISLRFANEMDGWELQLGHYTICPVDSRVDCQLPSLSYGLPLTIACQTGRLPVAEAVIDTGELKNCSFENSTLTVERRNPVELDDNFGLAILERSGNIRVVEQLSNHIAGPESLAISGIVEKPMAVVMTYSGQACGRWWWSPQEDQIKDWSEADILQLYPFMRWAGVGISMEGLAKRLRAAMNSAPGMHLLSIVRSCSAAFEQSLGFPARSSQSILLNAWAWEEALRCLLRGFQQRGSGAYAEWRAELPKLGSTLHALNPAERSTTSSVLARLDPLLVLAIRRYVPDILNWIPHAQNVQQHRALDSVPESLMRGSPLNSVLLNKYRHWLANDPNYAFSLLDKRRTH